MTRCLITGIGGSIGCHVLAHFLAETDWQIVGIDSFRHKGITDRVAVVMRDSNREVKIFTHDLRAPFSPLLTENIGEIDHAIHLASLSDVPASVQDPGDFIRDNTLIALNTLEWARYAKPKTFVQFSTDEVYGPTENGGAHKEWDTIVPSNPYSASKACQEAIAFSYWCTYGVPVIITNTSNNFGEMQQATKFPVIVQRKVSAGEIVTLHGTQQDSGSRCYIHSRNVADALLFILRNTKPRAHEPGRADRPDRYNIAGGKRLSNYDVAREIASLLGKDLHHQFAGFRKGHDQHYALDGSKLEELGWVPPLSFEDSLARTIAWQKQHPEWISLST